MDLFEKLTQYFASCAYTPGGDDGRTKYSILVLLWKWVVIDQGHDLEDLALRAYAPKNVIFRLIVG